MKSSVQSFTPGATRIAYVEKTDSTVRRATVWSVKSDRDFPPGVLGVTTRVHDDFREPSVHSPMNLSQIRCFTAPTFFNA